MDNLFLINEWNYRACYKKAGVKTLKLKQLSLKCDNLLWWYDYLRLLSYKSDDLLFCPCFVKVRNSTNNSQYFIPWSELESCPFDMVNISMEEDGKVMKYNVSVSYDNQPVKLCRFMFTGAKEWYLMSQIDIYGKAWRLQSAMNNEFLLDGFIRSLLMWWVSEEDPLMDILQVAFFTYYVSRADFRIDFWSKDKSFYSDYVAAAPHNLLKRNMKGKSTYYWEDGKTITDMTVGNKKNKYIFIRFYDKKQEIIDDNTQYLYSDYYNYEWKIYRLEFQFDSRFCTARKEEEWEVNWFDIFLGNKLTNRIFEYIWLSLKSGAFSRFYSPEKIPFDKLPLWKKKSIASRLTNTLNYLMDNGVEPLSFIEMAYKYKWEDNRLTQFKNTIPHYLENKEDTVKKLLTLFTSQ